MWIAVILQKSDILVLHKHISQVMFGSNHKKINKTSEISAK